MTIPRTACEDCGEELEGLREQADGQCTECRLRLLATDGPEDDDYDDSYYEDE